MVIKYTCPKCGKRTAIRYGKFKLKDGNSVSRMRCLSCNATSTFKKPFFHRLRASEKEIHTAVTLYIQMKPIRYIAQKLNRQPNTIVNWIKKLYDHPHEYKLFLMKTYNFPPRIMLRFFSNLRRAIRNRVTRGNKDELVAKLYPIFRPYDEQEEYISKHPTVKYRKDAAIYQ